MQGPEHIRNSGSRLLLAGAIACGAAFAADPASATLTPIVTPYCCDNGVSVGIGFNLTTDGNLTIGPQISYDVDVYNEDRWSVRYQAVATLPLVWINIPSGRIDGGIGPIHVKTEFVADPFGADLPGKLGFEPTGAAGIELTIPLDEDPKLKYYLELRLGLPIDGDRYRLSLPGLRYSWENEDGSISNSRLGTIVDFMGPAGSCIPSTSGLGHDCTFTEARITHFGIVPEPASWTMMLAGFGLVAIRLRRQRLSPAR